MVLNHDDYIVPLGLVAEHTNMKTIILLKEEETTPRPIIASITRLDFQQILR